MDAFTSHFRADKQAKKIVLRLKNIFGGGQERPQFFQASKIAQSYKSKIMWCVPPPPPPIYTSRQETKASRLRQDGEEQLCGMGQCLQPGGRGGGGGVVLQLEHRVRLYWVAK